METVQLGGLSVSAMGLGCMRMSEYAGPIDWDRSTAAIHRALDVGISLLDTADIYGSGHNEVLVGRAIRGCRDNVQLGTKFGIDRSRGDNERIIRGERKYVLGACTASLLRLDVDVIDLYYLHRPPDDVPIEETVGAMAELVEMGKVRYLGLSEVSAEQLRRAHAVHPIAAVQSEYSLWNRAVEDVTPTMAELDVGLVPYQTVGSRYLRGVTAPDATAAHVVEVATTIGATPAQVALAWVYAQAQRLGIAIAPIVGTTQPERIDEYLGALHLDVDSLST
jgi:aryl-alcohol dehydrogenase-like predicted oxidoreductase